MDLKMKKLGIGSLSLLLVLMAFLWGFEINGFCMGDSILATFNIPTWSNSANASGTHYTVFYTFIFLIPALIISLKYKEDRFAKVGKISAIIYLSLLVLAVLFMGGYSKFSEYTLQLPLMPGSFKTITIEQNEIEETIESSKDIEDIVNILSGTGRKTRTQSIQDFPTNVENVISVHFNCGEILTLYVYEKNNEYFIEQAYNGIYRISADEYNSIEKYIRNSSKNSASTEPYMPNEPANLNENKIENTTAIIQNFNRSPENVVIEVLEDTITKNYAEILITDNNQNHYGWGVDFRVQKKVNDKWEELNAINEMSFIEIAYEVDENNQIKMQVHYGEYYGALEKGIYRIVKPIYDNGYIDIYSNEFEIK